MRIGRGVEFVKLDIGSYPKREARPIGPILFLADPRKRCNHKDRARRFVRYRSYSALLVEPVEHLTHTQYICIFNGQVSEVRKMVALVFVRDALLGDDRSVPA